MEDKANKTRIAKAEERKERKILENQW